MRCWRLSYWATVFYCPTRVAHMRGSQELRSSHIDTSRRPPPRPRPRPLSANMAEIRRVGHLAGACFLASLLLLSSAFRSDELLQDEEEFVSDITASDPDLEYLQPVRPPVRKRADPDPSAFSDSKVQFSLEHAFGDSDFSPAGTFTARLKSLVHGGHSLTKLRFSRNTFTEKEKEQFQKLLEEDEFYRIRIPSRVLNPPGKDYVVSSVRARCLAQEGGLDEQFVIHLEGVNIVAVNYGSASSCQYPRLQKICKKWSFNSYTVLKTTESAPRTPAFTEAILVGEDGEGEGVKPPERSFWSKYWMYLIPLGLIVMNAFTQAMNMPEEQGGQQGSQAQQAMARQAPNPSVRRR